MLEHAFEAFMQEQRWGRRRIEVSGARFRRVPTANPRVAPKEGPKDTMLRGSLQQLNDRVT